MEFLFAPRPPPPISQTQHGSTHPRTRRHGSCSRRGWQARLPAQAAPRASRRGRRREGRAQACSNGLRDDEIDECGATAERWPSASGATQPPPAPVREGCAAAGGLGANQVAGAGGDAAMQVRERLAAPHHRRSLPVTDCFARAVGKPQAGASDRSHRRAVVQCRAEVVCSRWSTSPGRQATAPPSVWAREGLFAKITLYRRHHKWRWRCLLFCFLSPTTAYKTLV